MWKISILISTILLLNLTIMKSETNNTNIVSLKFKTYYPYINSSNSLYEAEDYYFNVHLSKIYLEIQLGDKHNFETKTNQTLNVIVDLNEKVFLTTNLYFNRFTLENYNLLCKYNTILQNQRLFMNRLIITNFMELKLSPHLPKNHLKSL